MESKIQSTHLGRSAVVYVRQSTFVQVETNRESTRRQYDLRSRAEELGWSGEQVMVIDEDQGRSGEMSEGRSGFSRLMSEVALGQVGIVLAVEASRLARNNADWQRLIWFCSLTETLLGDQDGLYDPSHLDDRMVLGLKGTISELEWHTIRRRLREAALSKAGRGELEIALPAGYQWQGGRIELTPDRQVADALRLVFEKFDDLGSARQVTLWLRDRQIQLPRRVPAAPKDSLCWRDATRDIVSDILTHPVYAGAYAYGRRRTVREIQTDGTVKKRTVELPREEWEVLIRDHHLGLIDWARYEQIERRLAGNRPTRSGPGPAREGAALLQGLVHCGRCGRRMAVAYSGRGRRFGQFLCRREQDQRGSESFCQTLGGRRIETAVVELVLDAVEPAAIEVALHALKSLQHEQEQVARHWQQRIEQAEYEAELARGRYEAVDVTHRLVSAELERRWNDALERTREVRREAEQQLQSALRELSELEQRRILRVARDVRRIWSAPTTSARDKKRVLRSVLERIVLTPGQSTVDIRVEWKGGQVSQLAVKRLRRGAATCVTDQEVVDLVHALARDGGFDDTQIARVLIKKNLRTATGLPFTKRRVQSVRAQYEIPQGRGCATDEPRYTAEQAAEELGVSSQTIHSWLREGLLAGDQITPGAPWSIALDEATRRRLAGRIAPAGWVGLAEAAHQLGVSKQTVSTWVKSGKLEAVRVARGRRKGWRINVSSTTCGAQSSLDWTKP